MSIKEIKTELVQYRNDAAIASNSDRVDALNDAIYSLNKLEEIRSERSKVLDQLCRIEE